MYGDFFRLVGIEQVRHRLAGDEMIALSRDLRIARQYGINPGDERVELPHEVLNELSCRLVCDVPVIVNQARLELDICLDRIHLWWIAECQNAAQMLLGDGGSNLSR
jgi:hypothetical protein